MGLMKLATYHKNRGDNVELYKGIMDKATFLSRNFDRIYITSMFTFHYAITLKTIKSYERLAPTAEIFVGGIMATLLSERLRGDIEPSTKMLTGLLVDSEQIGFTDHINIDALPLDYSILDNIEFEYPAGDNYLAYISRGCTNKCKFCAVPILEPNFCMTNNIVEQISTIKKTFGEKQNLLLLDNNILSFEVEELKRIVTDIRSLGFDKTTRFYPPLPLDVYLKKLSTTPSNSPVHKKTLCELVGYLYQKKTLRKSQIYQEKYDEMMEELDQCEDKLAYVLEEYDIFSEILSHYHNSPGRRRSVDFNQGMDARQLTEEKMEVLSQLPIEPFRLAFDSVAYTDIYIKAIKTAAKYGVVNFSNYILYNFEDKPEDLWHRLQININLAKELGIKIFSFPMKYAPIDRTDRDYIGKHWNKHYLSNVYAILNVTKGIVADGESFFYKAFGQTPEELIEILSMPREFVLYRYHFEELGLTGKWKEKYDVLKRQSAQPSLLQVLSGHSSTDSSLINDILPYYEIKFGGITSGGEVRIQGTQT